VDLTKEVTESFQNVPDPSQLEATPMFSLGLKEFCTQSQGFPSQSVELLKPDLTTTLSKKSSTVMSELLNNSNPTVGTGQNNTTSTSESQEPGKIFSFMFILV